jgi:hypothetical protein
MNPREPAGSIIERFRGTEWGAPEPPPPPPPRRGRGALTLLVAILVIGGAVGGVAILASMFEPSNHPPGGAQFLPDDGITPRVPDSIRVLDAFWRVARDPDLAYHLEGHGSAAAAGFDQSFELTLDVVGDDFSGTVNSIGGSGLADIIRLDGVIYARPTGKDWIIARTSDATLRQVPFMGLAGRRELEYDDAVVEGGETLHRLVTTKFYAPSVTRMLDLSTFGFSPDIVALELFVTDDGAPVRATFTCLVEGSVADKIPHFEGTAEYEFSAVGEPVTIQTPAP